MQSFLVAGISLFDTKVEIMFASTVHPEYEKFAAFCKTKGDGFECSQEADLWAIWLARSTQPATDPSDEIIASMIMAAAKEVGFGVIKKGTMFKGFKGPYAVEHDQMRFGMDTVEVHALVGLFRAFLAQSAIPSASAPAQ